jgi:class 3 adenylate cyclase
VSGQNDLRTLKHDLKTPINQILGYSELLEDELGETSAHVADLKKIQTAARKLLSLVESIGVLPSDAESSWNPERQGTGIVFRVEPSVEAAVTDPKEAGGSPGSLLVVDDNELNRDMLSRRLRGKGYEVEVADGGQAALEKLEKLEFDAVLLDVMMPGLSGLDVLKVVRKTRSASDLPVIMATAKDNSEDVVEALQLGANDYVTKPLDFPVVLARLQTALSLKRAKERVQGLAEELERRNRFIRKTFGRYLSDDVVASLLETPEGLRLGGEERRVTILMSDLRGFTSMAEGLPPEQVMEVLNGYLGTMTAILARHRATIDEFVGDAILALFGAPVQGPDDARRAVACALEMQLAMDAVNERNRELGLPPLEMGIALNTGEVVVGNIGSEARAKYGIVGSHVNLTGRIESFTVGGQVLLSESTREAAGPDVSIGRTMALNAKGFHEPVTVHELLGLAGDPELRLPEKSEDLPKLTREVPVAFSVLAEKLIDTDVREGALVALSPRGAVVRSSSRPALLANLRLRLVAPEGSAGTADFYGKVVEVAEGGEETFRLRFTSLPQPLAVLFAGWPREDGGDPAAS